MREEVLEHLFVFLFGTVTLAKKKYLWPKNGNFQECNV